MDTSKAFQQYLIDKEKQADARKQRKDKMKDIVVGGTIFTICCTAVATAANIVVSAIGKVK